LGAKALPRISEDLSIKLTHDYISYLQSCEILSGLLWRTVLKVKKHSSGPCSNWLRIISIATFLHSKDGLQEEEHEHGHGKGEEKQKGKNDKRITESKAAFSLPVLMLFLLESKPWQK
jgi:hypothetical protein